MVLNLEGHFSNFTGRQMPERNLMLPVKNRVMGTGKPNGASRPFYSCKIPCT